MLNGCTYCVEHHIEGLRKLLDDDARAQALRTALEEETWDEVFDERQRAILHYARNLTQAPDTVDEDAVTALRAVGMEDGEILEVNQVVSYFAYANRTVQGLGVTTDGDVLGLSPSQSDDPENWQHQ